MDDLNISPVSANEWLVTIFNDSNIFIAFFQENATANVFTGDEEVFAFQRTVSRLAEMQSSDYWEQWNKKSI